MLNKLFLKALFAIPVCRECDLQLSINAKNCS